MLDDSGNPSFKTNRLADNIPVDVLEQFLHRLIASLSEYEVEGKGKAYGKD